MSAYNKRFISVVERIKGDYGSVESTAVHSKDLKYEIKKKHHGCQML